MSDTIPQASDNGGAWGFSKRDAARIAHTVKRIEAQSFNGPAERGRYPIAGSSSLFPAQLTEALTAGTIGAPTTAHATRLVGSDSGAALILDPDGTTIDVYNTYSAGVASGKTVWCVSYAGLNYVVQADC